MTVKTKTKVRSQGPVVERFFATYLVHPKGRGYGDPFVLEQWERDFLNEFFRVDEDGRRVYRLAILGVPRGNGKTPLCAGLGLFELMARRESPEIFNCAGAKDQARLLSNFATAFARQKLATWLDSASKVVTHRETGGVMRLISSEGRLQHGLSIDAAIIDELHAMTTEAQEETYTALVTALHKKPNAYALAITTAGFNKNTLLGRLYDRYRLLPCEERNFVDGIGPTLRIYRDEVNGILMWWYGPPDDVDEEVMLAEPPEPPKEATAEERKRLAAEHARRRDELLRAVNPSQFQPLEEIKKNLPALDDEYDFLRLHFNAWTGTKEVFIPQQAWAGCSRPKIEPARSKPTFATVDIGLTHDTTAVAWSQPLARREGLEPMEYDDVERLEAEGEVDVVSRVRVWSARKDHERDKSARHVWVPGGRIDLEDVEEFILHLARQFRLMELVYDPAFFEGEAQRLAKRGLIVAPMYQAGLYPQIAAQRWYQRVKQGKALHGNDPVLNRHVRNATGIKTARGWKMDKLQDEPIDGAVAVSWSDWRASRAAGSVYDRRDPVVVGDEDDEEEVWL